MQSCFLLGVCRRLENRMGGGLWSHSTYLWRVSLFFFSTRRQPKSHQPGGGTERMNEGAGLGWVKVNGWFVGMGGGRVCWGVTCGPQSGAVWSWRFFSLGEYNGLFRVHPAPRSSSLAPEVLHFVRRTAALLCLSSPCLLISLACLRGARELIVFEPGPPSAGRIVYWGGGKSGQSQQRDPQEPTVGFWGMCRESLQRKQASAELLKSYIHTITFSFETASTLLRIHLASTVLWVVELLRWRRKRCWPHFSLKTGDVWKLTTCWLGF